MTQVEGHASNFDGDPPSQDIFSIINREIDAPELKGILNPRVIPALKLYAYNFFSLPDHATITNEMRDEFQRVCKGVNATEQEYAALPDGIRTTTGEEIEWYFHSDKENVFKTLGFKIASADDENPNDPLRELELPWTYSGATQAFAVEQLYQMGAFTNPDNPDAAKTPIGLHLNFAIPRNVQYQVENNEHLIVDTIHSLLLAYVSKDRLQQRKTKAASTFTTDKETEESLEASKKGKNLEMTFRLELRPFEIAQNTYRELLPDAQHLVIGLFERLRTMQPLAASSQAEIMSLIFESFSIEMWQLKQDYTIPFNFALVREGQEQEGLEIIQTLLDNEELVQKVQDLVSTTSQEIEGLIKGSDDDNL